MTLQLPQFYPSQQRLDRRGKFVVSKKAWLVRYLSIAIMLSIVAYQIYEGLRVHDPMVIFVTLLPIHSVTYMLIGWVFYRNPAVGHPINEQVTVIVPVFNQKDMIRLTLDAIYSNTYRNIAVVVINDGSTDGSKEILDDIEKSHKYPNFHLIHKRNEGKRKAVAHAFYYNDKHVKSDYVVMVDSDSILDRNAIMEIMKTFGSNYIYEHDKKIIGAVVGQAKVWNSGSNFLTKCQDGWYDYSFNIRKTAESVFGNVMCCSGCLAAYRVEAIRSFIPYWINAKLKDSEDREMTTWVISTKGQKKSYLAAIRENAREAASKFDYAEDRALTAESLREWQAVYTASAIVYTDVPESFSKFLRQQKRWKKGTIRVNWYVAMFFWRKNPILSILIFYTDFAMTFLSPILLVLSFVYVPLVTQSLLPTLMFMIGALGVSLIHGLDYKFRDPSARFWYFKPFMNLITGFVLTWLFVPAIIQMKRNEWGTR